MGFPIRQEFIDGIPKLPYRNGTGNYEGTVAHATAVFEDTAESERNYESHTWQSAFVHFFVDHEEIVQCAPIEYLSWGAGHVANQRYINIELCQTRDTAKFKASYNRYVWLHAHLLQIKKLGVTRLDSFWTHHDVSQHLGDTTHTDPDSYLASHGISIDQLVKDIQEQYDILDGKDAEPNGDATYVVKAGDTFWSIAKKYSGVTMDEIIKANPQVNPKALQIGERIVIPAHSGQVHTTTSTAPAHKVAVTLPNVVLKEGDHGSNVVEVQNALNDLHFNCGKADGDYGPATKNAVTRFQSMYASLVDDGVYGPSTRQVMEEELNK
jgi:N-acetylmuramoyl-L-alanine amidase CwlA